MAYNKIHETVQKFKGSPVFEGLLEELFKSLPQTVTDNPHMTYYNLGKRDLIEELKCYLANDLVEHKHEEYDDDI